MTDLISRQAAVEEVETRLKAAYAWFNDGVHSAKADGTISALIECVLMLKGLPAAEPGIVRCKECKHFHYDMPYVMQGIPILGHEVCDFWGDGCKTNENGFCSYAERRTDE